MVTIIAIRFDLRSAPDIGAPHAALYSGALEMASWADRVGIDSAVVSEHHFTDDGYLPSPIVLASAIAATTERIAITIAALLAPLHDPLRLAEDLAVLDHVAKGRTVVVLGLGYRPEEFAALGVDRSKRAALLEAAVAEMRRAWSGEAIERNGVTLTVGPPPFTPGGPMLFIGGSAPVSARRAARLGLPFYSAVDDPALADEYHAETQRLGLPPGFAMLPSGPTFVHVSDDPDKDFADLVPHMLHDARTYRDWQTPGNRSVVESQATTADEIRAEGKYLVVTPEQCVELIERQGPSAAFVLHPLMGGIHPDRAWASLELFESKVLPAIHPDAPSS